MIPAFNSTQTLTIGPLTVRFNWLVFACVLLTAITFIRLGFWQLSRAEEKMLAQQEYAQRQQQNALSVESISSSDLQAGGAVLSDLHVSLFGEYLNEQTILVQAQFFDGQIGYEVVTPFKLQSDPRLVLVSRGWTTGILPSNTAPSTRPVAGTQTLTAQIHIPDSSDYVISSTIDSSQWPLRIRSMQVSVLQALFDAPLFPYVVRLTEGQPGVLVRHWPVTNVNINSNLSYALQWFTFAVIVLIASLLASSNTITLLRDKP